jgi:hypothetical protein
MTALERLKASANGTHEAPKPSANGVRAVAVEEYRAPEPQDGSTPPDPVAADVLLGPPWPCMDPAAFHGPAGELVKLIDPHTEADPVAILSQSLVGFGSLIGRTAYYQHEADKHFGNEFLVLVGDTADGRKGTSWGHVRRALGAVDPTWADTRIVGGLSSGEGLLHEIRDGVKDDAGVEDKRLLVVEPEFANVLRQFERQGNTLSGILRQAWEGGPLRTLVKTSPARCKEPHLSLIGHITADELRKCLTATDAANGLANRHIFTCVKRSKMLPDGGFLNPQDLEGIQEDFRAAADFARASGRLMRDQDCRELWHDVYPRLSTARPGLAGAMTARALAHVTRLSMLYAILDRSGWIQVPHLRAALACWEYAAASVAYVFGDSLGNDVADEVLDQLRVTTIGLSKTEIRDMFQRHKKAREIDAGLALLEKLGLAEQRPITTGGRPAQRWFAATKGG